jgi:O-antigen/teichoic acid export membrane protein
MQRDRRLLAASLSTIAIRSAGAALGLLVTVALGRLLGPSDLGVYALMSTVATLLAIPIGSGWQRVLLRAASGAHGVGAWGESLGLERRGQQLAVGFAVLAGAAALALHGAGWPGAVRAASVPMIVSLAAVLLFDQLSALRSALLRAYDRAVLGQVPEMLVRPAAQVVLVALALVAGARAGVEMAVYTLAGGALASFAVGAAMLRRARPAAARGARTVYRMRAWLGSAAAMSANSLFSVLNAQASLLLIGLLGSTHDAGLYRVGLQVSLVAGMGYTAVTMVAYQRFAYYRALHDEAGATRAAHLFARLAFACALPVPLLLLVAGGPLFAFLFGAAFMPAADVAQVLNLGQVVNAGLGMSGALLVMHGRETVVTRATMAAMAVNVALGVLLVPRVGAMGAAIASSASLTVLNVATLVAARRETGIDTSIVGLPTRVVAA